MTALAPVPARAAGPTALVVDDDYRSTLAFTALLERNQFEVVSAPSGYTALDALDDRDDIGIVVMDIMMSVMDGYATMAAIRRRPRFAELPIIAVTAKADDGENASAVSTPARRTSCRSRSTRRRFCRPSLRG